MTEKLTHMQNPGELVDKLNEAIDVINRLEAEVKQLKHKTPGERWEELGRKVRLELDAPRNWVSRGFTIDSQQTGRLDKPITCARCGKGLCTDPGGCFPKKEDPHA